MYNVQGLLHSPRKGDTSSQFGIVASLRCGLRCSVLNRARTAGASASRTAHEKLRI